MLAGTKKIIIIICGLRLDNEAVRVAVGLRLGNSLCEPHQCPCGKQVDARGTHDLSCKRAPADPYDTINSTTYASSTNENKHAIRSGTARTVAHRRKTTGWADPHSMSSRKESHMGCHHHRHRHRLISSSNIDEGWWRCRELRHQEGGQVR